MGNAFMESSQLPRILTSELSQHVGQRIRLMGWLHRVRKLGEVNFVVVRDRAGIAQAVVGPAELEPLHGLQSETGLSIEGEAAKSEQAPGGYELYQPKLDVISPVTEDIPFALYKSKVRANLPPFLDHAVIGHRPLARRS